MSKKKVDHLSHYEAMTTAGMALELAQVFGSWLGLIYFVVTGQPSWAVLMGTFYLGCMVRSVAREIAYRDDKRGRSIYGDIHISGGQR